MRISDWSSDVCSSDLRVHGAVSGGSHLDAARGRRDRGGAEDIEGVFLILTERHDAATREEILANAVGRDGAGGNVVAIENGDAADEVWHRLAAGLLPSRRRNHRIALHPRGDRALG